MFVKTKNKMTEKIKSGTAIKLGIQMKVMPLHKTKYVSRTLIIILFLAVQKNKNYMLAQKYTH